MAVLWNTQPDLSAKIGAAFWAADGAGAFQARSDGAKQLRVRKQLNDGKLDDALVRFEQFERKMDNLEGRVEAYDVGKKADLKQEISNLEDEEQIEQALDNLKKRLSNKTASSDA